MSNSVKSILFGVIGGFIATILLMLLFVVVITVKDVPQNLFPIVFGAIMIIGAYITGFISVKIKGEKGLYWGLLSGFVYFLVYSIISMFSPDTNGIVVLTKLIISIISSIFGGITAINSKRRFKSFR